MTHLRRRSVKSALAVTAALLALGGGAYAYWSATGSGTGSASAASTTPVTLAPGTLDSSLYPGGSASVTVHVDNPNAAAVHISNLLLDTTQGTGGFAVDAAHASCGVSSLSYTAQNNAGVGWDVPGKVGSTDGALSISLPNAISMSVSAPNSCQGATFSVYLAAN